MTNKVMDDVSLKLLVVAAILAAITAASEQQAISGCKENCGDLRIPFPFGIDKGCYLDEKFMITCNASGAFHSDTGIQVLNISLDGQLRVSSEVAYDCYNKDGNRTISKQSRFADSKFPISHTHNKFTAVGCDTYAYIQGVKGHLYATGCISFCDQKNDVVNGSCGGIGCCQTSIPEGVWDFQAGVDSYYNHVYVFDYNPCSYAFLADENYYNFSFLDLPDLQNVHSFPVVLDWAIGNETCNVAKKDPETYACKGNSTCIDSDNGPGYRCSCSDGYTGNPYVLNGCQDINECSDSRFNQCAKKCTNTVGNYSCSCPKGFRGDGRKDGSGCMPDQKSQVGTIVGVSTGLTGLFMVLALLFFGQQKRRMVKARKQYFKHNGGYLLQQLLFTRKSSNNAAKIFTEEELKKATNNFNKAMVIGQGGYGVVYKGILSGGHIVAIKKSKAIDRSQIQQFVNEVIVLSQINHPNAVKLLGCCLETPVPLLVYEFITNGTLFHHVHGAEELMPWRTRLRIAEETAGALAYMHSLQIIHRDVKSANILLDENYKAKVSDFGVSRLVPFEQDQISTLVQGTLGYMDPEYFQSGILTEKSDVYSFGVVLVELLTGKKAICPECAEKSLALYFISSLKENRLLDILENVVRKEGEEEQLQGVAELARNCLRLEGDQRPTMKQVLEELDNLKQFGEKSPMKLQHSFDGGKEYSTFNSLNEINSFNSFQIEAAHRKIAEILNSTAVY